MTKASQTPQKLRDLIKCFKQSLRQNREDSKKKKGSKSNIPSNMNFYEVAKKAETEERNLWKALQLYAKAIQNGQKKDSSIKDFASSVHQLGFTTQAVKFMDDCQNYYDGNIDKYRRLRDNLQLQIRPTGKHQCRFVLIENLLDQLKTKTSEEQLKNLLFMSPKRIKGIKFFQNLDLQKPSNDIKISNYILLQFQSFSAAKKTLESFNFQEYFQLNLYWVNAKTLKIVCGALDGKKDFEENLIIDDPMIAEKLSQINQAFWTIFGEKIYKEKKSLGFTNLLSTHLIKDYISEELYKPRVKENKQNIFERSKINSEEDFKYYDYKDQPQKFCLNQKRNQKRHPSKKNYYDNYDCYDENDRYGKYDQQADYSYERKLKRK